MAKSWWWLAGKTFYNLTRWWPRKKVLIDPLPEQIQAYYREHPTGRTGPHIRRDTREHEYYREHPTGPLMQRTLKEGLPRILLFFDLLPEEEALPRGESYLHVWEKYGDNWILTCSGFPA
jgi:hypothetical protein